MDQGRFLLSPPTGWGGGGGEGRMTFHTRESIWLAVCRQQNVSGKSGWQVNGTEPFGSFHWKSSERTVFEEKLYAKPLIGT